MGLEFLARVRSATLWLGVVAMLVGVTYSGWATGLGIAAGAAWSLANLFALERLVVTITGPGRRTGRALGRAGVALAGLLALFGLGALLLVTLPPAALMTGFGFPFAVMVLKAASALLVGSDAWRRFTASRWQVALAGFALVAAFWLIADRVGAAGDPHATTAAESTAAAHGTDAHAAPEAHGATAHGEAKSKGVKMFPNFLGVIIEANHGQPWADWLHHVEPVFFSLFTALLLGLVAWVASRRRDLIPGRFQTAVEMVVSGLHDFVVGILGPKYGPRYLPFLGSLFLYILAMNWIGFVPGFHAATANINITVALALSTFIYVQFTGMKELGLLGWVDHMAGSPRSPIEWILVPLMLPIHVIGELAKPLSLACRLFGNIFGEDMLLVGFTSLGIMAMGFIPNTPIGLPLQLPFLFFCLLTSTLQALVFTVLSSVYLLLMLPHDDHGSEGEDHHAHVGAH